MAKKKKLNKKKFLVFILLIYLLCTALYYLYNTSVKTIIISGNNHVRDHEIIKSSGLKNYPSFFGFITKKSETSIEKLDLIKTATVSKKLNFRVKIDIEEETILFLNSNTNKVRLTNGKEISKENIMGIPVLINYVPEEMLANFSENFGILDQGIISLINEIKYSPKTNDEGEVIDDTSFTLYMNDGNTVITTPDKCKSLSKYREIYASLSGKQGILNLDSGNYENFVFIPY